MTIKAAHLINQNMVNQMVKVHQIKDLIKSQWQGIDNAPATSSTSSPPTKLLTGVEVYQAEKLKPLIKPTNALESLNQFNDNSSTSYLLDKSNKSYKHKVSIDKSTHYHIGNLTFNSNERTHIFLNGVGVGLGIGSIAIFLAWVFIAFL